MNQQTTTGADKARSYSGDYMAAGKKAEEIVMRYLQTNPYIIGINDFRQLRAIQEADVDIAIKTIDGRVTLAEIKSDWHLGVSGNVLFEVLRINHTAPPDRSGTLGWSCRTPANYILYYAPQVHKIYKFKTCDLRAAFQRYTEEARKGTDIRKWVSVVKTDEIKTTINVLIPWKYCESIATIYSDLEKN